MWLCGCVRGYVWRRCVTWTFGRSWCLHATTSLCPRTVTRKSDSPSCRTDTRPNLTALAIPRACQNWNLACVAHTHITTGARFVTRVAQSRALPKLLLSSGGEPSVCVWEVPSGKRLHVDTLGLDSAESGAASGTAAVAGAGAGGAGAGASEAAGAGSDAKPVIVALAVCGVTKTVAVALLKSPTVSLYALDAETGALAAAGEVASPRNVSDVAFTSEGTLVVADEAGGLSLFATLAGEHRFAPVSSVPAWAPAMSEILAEGTLLRRSVMDVQSVFDEATWHTVQEPRRLATRACKSPRPRGFTRMLSPYAALGRSWLTHVAWGKRKMCSRCVRLCNVVHLPQHLNTSTPAHSALWWNSRPPWLILTLWKSV